MYNDEDINPILFAEYKLWLWNQLFGMCRLSSVGNKDNKTVIQGQDQLPTSGYILRERPN
jgi:hypothetical protein